MIVQDATPSGKKIFKPHGEEFTLADDFPAIADALSVTLDQVNFSLIDDTNGSIDGHSLVGVAA